MPLIIKLRVETFTEPNSLLKVKMLLKNKINEDIINNF